MDKPVKYLSVHEVADVLQVTPRTVRNLINRGRFPGAHKIDPESSNSRFRIPKQDLEAHLEKQRSQY